MNHIFYLKEIGRTGDTAAGEGGGSRIRHRRRLPDPAPAGGGRDHARRAFLRGRRGRRGDVLSHAARESLLRSGLEKLERCVHTLIRVCGCCAAYWLGFVDRGRRLPAVCGPAARCWLPWFRGLKKLVEVHTVWARYTHMIHMGRSQLNIFGPTSGWLCEV